jgi:hypothetical protein
MGLVSSNGTGSTTNAVMSKVVGIERRLDAELKRSHATGLPKG